MIDRCCCIVVNACKTKEQTDLNLPLSLQSFESFQIADGTKEYPRRRDKEDKLKLLSSKLV